MTDGKLQFELKKCPFCDCEMIEDIRVSRTYATHPDFYCILRKMSFDPESWNLNVEKVGIRIAAKFVNTEQPNRGE